jgi:hypothetical protein
MTAEEFADLRDEEFDPHIMSAHELGLASFVLASRKARFKQLLRAPTGRAKLRKSFPHFRDLDPAACHTLESGSTASSIAEVLLGFGAPEMCYVLSENPEVDAALLPLDFALSAVVGKGFGTFVSCVPGRLAYFEGEGPSVRCILRRAHV